MSLLPPLYDPLPWSTPRTCGRQSNDGTHCDKPATWHVIWTEDVENGLCCDEHMDEAREQWVFYAHHAILPACAREGSDYYHDLNVCLMPDEGDLGIDAHTETSNLLALEMDLNELEQTDPAVREAAEKLDQVTKDLTSAARSQHETPATDRGGEA